MCDIYSNMQFSNLLFDNLPISNNSINYNEYINFIKNLDKEIDFYTKNSYNLRKNIKLQKTKIFNQIKYDKYNYENNLNLIQNKIKYLNIFFNNFIKLYFLNKNMIQFYKETYDSFFLFNNSTTYSFLNYKYHLCQSLLLKNNKIMDEIKDDLIYIGSHFQIILNELIFIFNKTKNKFDKDEYYNIFNFNFQTINIDFDFIKNNLNETYLYFKKSIKKVQTIKNNYKTSKINYDEILILCKNIIFNINIKSLEYDITKNNLINLINSIRKTILDILIHYINNIIIDIIYKIEIENNKRKIKILKPKYSIDYVFNILEINNKIITNRNPLILSSSKLLYPK